MSKYSTGDLIRDKFRGILVGGAIGDAWGGPYNSLDDFELLTKYPNGMENFIDYPEFIRGKRNEYQRPAGSYTDDTQQTILVAEHLAKHGELIPSILAKNIANLVESGNYRAGGNNSRSVFSKISKGEDYKRASSHTAETTGSLMRISPIPTFYWTDLEKRRDATLHCSVISHKNPAVIFTCLEFSRMIQLSINGYPMEKRVSSYKSLLSPNSDIIKIISESTTNIANITQDKKSIEASKMLKATVVASDAMEAFSLFPHNFKAAISYAATNSVDRDTCAKLAGELVAARNDIRIIPENLIDQLEDGEKILTIGDRLYEKHIEIFGKNTPKKIIDTGLWKSQ